METRQERTARAIITLGSYVLLSRAKGEPYFCLPGGHCEAGELPADTVKRELLEETGREICNLRYLTTIQNNFEKRGVHIEEEMHLFRADLTPILKENPAQSAEDHLINEWVPVVDTPLMNVMPPAVVSYILFVGGT